MIDQNSEVLRDEMEVRSSEEKCATNKIAVFETELTRLLANSPAGCIYTAHRDSQSLRVVLVGARTASTQGTMFHLSQRKLIVR